MAIKKYPATLTDTERLELRQLIGAGVGSARTLTRARILLKADQSPAGPAWVDAAIAEALEVSQPTVARVRKRYVQAGLTAALHARPPRREYRRKLDGAQEAHLIALACSEPPDGAARWSLRLLADRLVELEIVDAVSHQTVRRTLKQTS
jgi:DNA-binding transcriptional ArsR family regulator